MSRTRDRRAKAPLDFVHSVLAGPVSLEGTDGFEYALSFVDDYNGVIMIYFKATGASMVD